VVQVNALAIAARLKMIVKILAECLAPRSVMVRTEPSMAKAEAMDVEAGPIWGEPPDGPVFIEEHGLRYGVDLASGQKTGFYLDQRENRRVVAGLMAGRRVLDVFCYSGGFSLSALRLGGARETLGIDGSDRAIAWAEANARLNGENRARFRRADGFKTLEAFRDSGRQFDAVILDPPKFASSRRGVAEAIRAYHRINRLAVELLPPEGILVTCSCSGSVTREDFLRMLAAVSRKSGREIQVIEQRGPAADHPLSPTCLENEYLKCFLCRVV
jgi:23S rRNA (cytosine1962-C5)-methyltransferase